MVSRGAAALAASQHRRGIMRIVYLLESATGLWGGVKSVLETAGRLQARGHEVTVVSKSGPPAWMQVACAFRSVDRFTPEVIPAADVVVGTFWTTVPAAVQAHEGRPVHYCQGYEGDNPENAAVRAHIEAVYRLSEPVKVTISHPLATLLRQRFGCDVREVPYAIDHDVMTPGELRPSPRPVRVGVIGPWEVAWKDVRTGIEACALAARAGMPLQLVRITNTAPHPEEQALPFPVEWHSRVPPARMGELYRSLDVFLGTSRGHEEGFFLPAVEAMACGVPCVLTDIPCHRAYGDVPPALFVPPSDPAAMAEALVVTGLHSQVRNDLRLAGLGTAAQYHYERHVDALERVFEELAGGTRAAAPAVHAATAGDAGLLADLDRSLHATLRAASDTYVAVGRTDVASALRAAAAMLADTAPADLANGATTP